MFYTWSGVPISYLQLLGQLLKQPECPKSWGERGQLQKPLQEQKIIDFEMGPSVKFVSPNKGLISIQPEISGYIAKNLWSYSHMAIQPYVSGYIASSYKARDYWLISFWLSSYAWLSSSRFLRNFQLYGLEYLALQPRISGVVSRNIAIWLYSQKALAILPGAI